MKTLKVFQGDFVYENGRLVWLYGIDALAQILKNCISRWLNEWFITPTDGTDWLNLLGGVGPGTVRIEAAIRQRLLIRPEVIEIVSLTVSESSGNVIVNFSVKTTEGLVDGAAPLLA